MENLVNLTELLVKNLVKEPDMITVKQFLSEDDFIVIQVLVSNADMGAVIGKGGNVANSIRTIVQAASFHNNLQKVKINFDSF